MTDTRDALRPDSQSDRSEPDDLVLDHVSIAFGTTDGLRDLCLRARAGEQLALLGPSGVGKTSLLRAIAGLHTVTSGRVLLDGRDITAFAPERRGVVYLHQTPALFPHLSVLDNVAFPFEVRGIARANARARAASLLAQVRLEGFALRHPAALSGGQRHRVALARALAARPAVLLLDEPFAALDPSLRADVRDAVFALFNDTSATRMNETDARPPIVLLVTHDIDEAVALTQRVVVLLDGRIAQDDASSAVLARPRTIGVARFLGVPNLVPGMRDALGVVTSALGVIPSAGRVGAVWIASRPDALVAVTEASGASPVVGAIVAAHERMSGATVQVRIGKTTVFAQRANTELRVGDHVAVVVHDSRVHVIDADDAAEAVANTPASQAHV